MRDAGVLVNNPGHFNGNPPNEEVLLNILKRDLLLNNLFYLNLV